jgi:hypothetical protein
MATDLSLYTAAPIIGARCRLSTARAGARWERRCATASGVEGPPLDHKTALVTGAARGMAGHRHSSRRRWGPVALLTSTAPR